MMDVNNYYNTLIVIFNMFIIKFVLDILLLCIIYTFEDFYVRQIQGLRVGFSCRDPEWF